MNEANRTKLITRFPRMFNSPIIEITCGDGWFNLVNNLCEFLQNDIDRCGYPPIHVITVKEKFGGLRFYYAYYPLEKGQDTSFCRAQEGAVQFAEWLSESICEECGSTDTVRQTTGVIKSLCPKCMAKSLMEEIKKWSSPRFKLLVSNYKKSINSSKSSKSSKANSSLKLKSSKRKCQKKSE